MSSSCFFAGAIWPFAALYDIATKAEAGDAAGVSERIDFAAVRRSLVRQIITAYLRISKIAVDPNGLTSAIAGSVADPIVEKLISPQALTDLLRNGWPAAALPDRPPGLAGLSSAHFGNWWALFADSEYGLVRVLGLAPAGKAASAAVSSPISRLSRQGWKLSGLDLPDEILTKLTEQVVARGGVPTAADLR